MGDDLRYSLQQYQLYQFLKFAQAHYTSRGNDWNLSVKHEKAFSCERGTVSLGSEGNRSCKLSKLVSEFLVSM